MEWESAAEGPDHRAIEGTLVFADVSGFTALSELLARKGKVGAEQMVDILNLIFGDLLGVAASWGGQMLKFGGDALLLFFTGDDHAMRAASAAHWMQRRIGIVGRVNTGSGRLQLRMSVGMNSGVFDVFRVGGSHIELVITGPATTVTVAMEAAADATDVLLSRITASQVPEHCLGAEKAGGRLLTRAPRRVPPSDPTLVGDDVDGAPFIAPLLRPYVEWGGSEPEHRQVTIAFLHILGVDQLLATDDPHNVAARLDRAMRHVQQVLENHRVVFLATDVASDGTKVMASAGAPFTTGNDEERVLRALHEIVTADVGLPMRAGVNRGRVFTGDVGPAFRRTYTTIGDPTNTAARVMGQAEPGQLLTLSSVLERSTTVFEVEELAPFAAKGKSEPLVPFLVGRPAGRRSSTRRAIPFLGRDAELAEMRSVIDALVNGARQVVEVAGQAGMGTSRLVEEALRGAPDVAAVVARCIPYDETAAYSGVGRILTSIIGERSRECLEGFVAGRASALVPWVPLLAMLLDVEGGTSAEVEALDAAELAPKAAEILDRLLGEVHAGPVAVVLEDAHWCDSASVVILRSLAAQPSTEARLLCFTRQPGDQILPGSTLLHLGPIPVDAARQLVRAITERPLLPQEIDDLVGRADGNPLFLSELVRAVAGDGELPDSLEAYFAARIDGLDPVDRAALRYAAVVGADFDTVLVEKLLAHSGRLPGVDWPALANFVRVEAGSGAFVSVLAREAAYEALPFRQRRALHQEVGEVLEELGTSSVEALARHFRTGEDHARTWRYARSAASRAELRHAYLLAATFHRWAAAAGRRLPDVEPVRIGSTLRCEAEALRRAGQLSAALERYGAARRSLPAGHAMVPQLCIDRGAVSVLLGQRDAANRWYREAARLLEAIGATATPMWAQVLLGRANIEALQGRLHKALALSTEATELAGATADPGTQLSALALSHTMSYRLGLDDRHDRGLAALRLAEALGDLRQQATVLGNLGVDAHLSGRVGEAIEYYERTRDVAARSGQAIAQSVAANNIGEIHLDAGEHDKAVASFVEAEMTADAAGHWYAEVSRANRGRSLARSGRLDEGRRLVMAAVGALRARGVGGVADEVAGWLEELDALPEPAGDSVTSG